jgi:PIN domain nuclease of toxin-antitoxin system
MILLDTHALVWWVSGSSSLSGRARSAIEHARSASGFAVSAITFLEVATLVRRGRFELGVPLADWVGDLARVSGLRIEPVTAPVAQMAGSLGDAFPGDPIDRVIAATAINLQARLVTADRKLRTAPRLRTLW